MSLAPAVPQRDRRTWVSYAQMGAYGFFVYALGASQILLRDEQQTSRTIAGLHGSGWALGIVIMSFASPRISARIGRGRAMRMGSILLIGGILGYTSGLPVVVTIASVVLAGCGGALMVAGLSAFLGEQQGPAASASLSEANAFGAIAGFAGAVGVGIGVAVALGWRPALWLLIVILICVEMWRGRAAVTYDLGEVSGVAGRWGDLPRLFWWCCLVMLPAAGIEYCLALWTADLLREQGGFGDGAATAALGVVVAGLITGRVVGGWLAQRVDPEKLLIGAFALSGMAFLIAWATPILALLVGFLFITGIGVGLHWPLAIARAMRAVPQFADLASGVGLLCAGLAIMTAPFALGVIADSAGLRTAFLVVPVLALLGVLVVWYRPVPVVSGSAG
jgi:MFS family permease